jgi:hypothetical protein
MQAAHATLRSAGKLLALAGAAGVEALRAKLVGFVMASFAQIQRAKFGRKWSLLPAHGRTTEPWSTCTDGRGRPAGGGAGSGDMMGWCEIT